MEKAALPSFTRKIIKYTWTIRNCDKIYFTRDVSICISLHMQYVYRIGIDIHLPMGSLSFFRREIRRERERERLSVVVPEWAVVHSDVSCSDWLLVSLAALCDLNIFRQKSLRPRTAPWFCSSLEKKKRKKEKWTWMKSACSGQRGLLQQPLTSYSLGLLYSELQTYSSQWDKIKLGHHDSYLWTCWSLNSCYFTAVWNGSNIFCSHMTLSISYSCGSAQSRTACFNSAQQSKAFCYPCYLGKAETLQA